MAFAAPVLAERAHVRRRPSARRCVAWPATPRRELAAPSVTRRRHLRGQNVDPGGVEWDAWRREDGRWR